MTENVCVINSIVMSCTYVTHFIGYGTHDNTTQNVFGKVNTGFDNIYMKNRKTFRLYNKWMLVTVEIEMGKWLIVFLVYNKRVFFVPYKVVVMSLLNILYHEMSESIF